mgnify:CR=1 FL=1
MGALDDLIGSIRAERAARWNYRTNKGVALLNRHRERLSWRRDVTMDSAGVRIGSPSIITPTEFVSVFL